MIDPRADIHPGAELADGVSVGPFSVIGDGVKIDSGCKIGPHVVIKGITEIGRDNRIFQFSSIGEDPQDKKYAGESTLLKIGDRNVIREFVTLNRGTAQDEGLTSIGSDNLLMAYVHVAHDCHVGNHAILANGASLAGHVQVEDWAILGGFTLVHQFSRVGAHSFTGMGSAIGKDVPPYVRVSGQPAKPHGINTEGLKRRGYTPEDLSAIKKAYKTLYKSGFSLEAAIEEIDAAQSGSDKVARLVEFLRNRKRSIIR